MSDLLTHEWSISFDNEAGPGWDYVVVIPGYENIMGLAKEVAERIVDDHNACRSLSPPEPTEGRLAELLAATEFLTWYKDDPERPDDKMTGARVTFGEVRRIIAARTALRSMPLQDHARPASEYDASMGAVLWWKFPIAEPPYVGAPDDCGMTVEVDIRHYVGGEGEVKTTSARTDVGGWPGYHTHFTPLAIPAMVAEDGTK